MGAYLVKHLLHRGAGTRPSSTNEIAQGVQVAHADYTSKAGPDRSAQGPRRAHHHADHRRTAGCLLAAGRGRCRGQGAVELAE